MKALLICGSLVANVALLAALAFRPSLAPPAMRGFFSESSAAATPAAAAAKPKAAAKPAGKLWTQLDTTDLHALVRRLQAAGFPPNVIRSIVNTLVNGDLNAKLRELMLPDPNQPFWRAQPFYTANDKRYAAIMQLQRDRAKLLRDLTGDLDRTDSDVTASQRRRYGNLAPAKIEMLQRIEDDYGEMTNAIRSGMHGIELQEDRDKLALLAKEKRADLAAVLTPDELAEYEMRTSPLTQTLRGRLAAFDASATEYRSIYQAYQAAGENFPKTGNMFGPDSMELRDAAEQKLATSLKVSLGDARYNDFLRATSSDYQQLSRMVQQQNLPADTADRALAVRDAAAERSVQIAEDSTLERPAKTAALKTLADNTRLQLETLMPGEAGQSYVKRASWLAMLDHGTPIMVVRQPPLVVVNDMGGTMSFGTMDVRPAPVRRAGHP